MVICVHVPSAWVLSCFNIRYPGFIQLHLLLFFGMFPKQHINACKVSFRIKIFTQPILQSTNPCWGNPCIIFISNSTVRISELPGILLTADYLVFHQLFIYVKIYTSHHFLKDSQTTNVPSLIPKVICYNETCTSVTSVTAVNHEQVFYFYCHVNLSPKRVMPTWHD